MGVLDILYPARCAVCHEIVQGKGSICPKCRKKLIYIKEPKCKKCGKQLDGMEQEYCSDCQRFSHSFDRGAAVFAYDQVMRRSISMFKSHHRREYAKFYAREMQKQCAHFLKKKISFVV